MKYLLIYSSLVVLLFTGCGEDKKVVNEEVKVANDITIVKKEEVVSEVNKETITVKKDNVIAEATNEAKALVSNTVEKVNIKVEDETQSINAKILFGACAVCHGQNGEKAALGKSQIIKGWDKEKVIAALNGYKDGSYGGVMKGVMKSQVINKTDAEIEALAEFISNL